MAQYQYPVSYGESMGGDSTTRNKPTIEGVPTEVMWTKLVNHLRPTINFGNDGDHGYSRNWAAGGCDWFLINALEVGFVPQIDYQYLSFPRFGVGPQIRDRVSGTVRIQIGSNNSSPGVPAGSVNTQSYFYQLYNSILPITGYTYPGGTDPTYASGAAYAQALVDLARGHIETIKAYRNVPIVIVSALDHGLTPNVQLIPEYGDIAKRQLVQNWTENELNTRMKALCEELGLIYLDLDTQLHDILGPDGNFNAEIQLRGTTIDLRRVGPLSDPTAFWLDDGIDGNVYGVHPHWVMHCIWANIHMYLANKRLGATYELITELELAQWLGLPDGTEDTLFPELEAQFDSLIFDYQGEPAYFPHSYFPSSYFPGSFFLPHVEEVPPELVDTELCVGSLTVQPTYCADVSVDPTYDSQLSVSPTYKTEIEVGCG